MLEPIGSKAIAPVPDLDREVAPVAVVVVLDMPEIRCFERITGDGLRLQAEEGFDTANKDALVPLERIFPGKHAEQESIVVDLSVSSQLADLHQLGAAANCGWSWGLPS